MLKRILCGLLVAMLMFSYVGSIAYAAPTTSDTEESGTTTNNDEEKEDNTEDKEEDKSGESTSAVVESQKLQKEGASSKVISDLNQLSDSITKTMSGTEIAVTDLMEDYACYLATLDWVANTYYEIRTDKSKYPVIDETLLVEKWNFAVTQQSEILSKGVLSTAVDTSKGVSATVKALEGTTLKEAQSAADILDTEDARKLLEDICEYYFEANINVLACKALGANISEASSPEFVRTQLVNAVGAYTGGAEAAYNKVITECGTELRVLAEAWANVDAKLSNWYGLSLAENEKITINGTEQVGDGRQNEHNAVETTALESPAKEIVETLLKPSSVADSNNVSTMQTVNTSDDILSLMTNAKIVNGEITIDGDTGELTPIGYAITAASSVYDPFVSIAGNDLYMETIGKFLTTDQQREDVMTIIETAINTKKPLYVVSNNAGEWTNSEDYETITVGDYSYARLTQLLDFDSSNLYAFAVIKGSMQSSAVDSNVMEYVRGANEMTTQETTAGETAEAESSTSDQNISDTGTTVDSIADSGAAGISGSNVTVGNDSIVASQRQMTMPLVYTAGMKAKSSSSTAGLPYYVGSTTTAMLYNAAADVKNNKYIQNPDSYMLFVNGLGDIVLADNTVIIPAAANPAYYEYEELKITMENSTDSMSVDGTEWTQTAAGSYYPYTCAWFNHYPTIRVLDGTQVSADQDNDDGKLALVTTANSDESKTLAFVQISGTGEGSTKFKRGSMLTAAPMAIGEFSTGDDAEAKVAGYRLFELGQGSAGFLGTLSTFVSDFRITDLLGVFANDDSGIDTGANSAINNAENVYYVPLPLMSSNGLSFFPLFYDSSDLLDSYVDIAAAITTSTLRYISDKDDATGGYSSSGKYRVDFFVESVLAEARRGTQYAETLVKNAQISYEDIVEDTDSRIQKFFVSIAENALETLGKIEGVLAIRNNYENPFFNTIVQFLRNYYLFIALALVAVIAVRFLQKHFNMTYVVFMSLVVIAGFEVYTQWMPTLVPSLYNFLVNDVVEDITWSTLFNNSERYEELTTSGGRLSFDGAEKPYTSTITLYTLTQAEMDTVADRLGVDDSVIQSGDLITVDATGGVFLQGNQLKVSLDTLLMNNSTRGLYLSQWELLAKDEDASTQDLLQAIDSEINKNPYFIALSSPYVGLEDYYTPFNHIEKSFIQNLNNFTNIFSMQRQTYSYGKSIYKDAFVVNSFTNSGIFNAPGDDEILRKNINDKTITGEAYNVDKVIQYVHQLFDPQEDWLNLVDIFMEPDDSFKDSLWGLMLQRKGYYSKDWTMDEDQEVKVSNLISYINNHTKLWVNENLEELQFISDDNAIKLISLYATTCFAQRVSDPGYWLYPVYVNSQDITLEDVLYGSMTTSMDRNAALDGTVVNTIALTNGTVGVILLMLIVVLSASFIFVITHLIPILYALFGILMVVKMIKTQNGTSLARGYLKVTGMTIVLYLCFSLSLLFVKVGGYAWYSYLGCAFLIFLCNYFLFFTCLSVVQNISDLGDATLQTNLLRASNLMTRGLFENLRRSTSSAYGHSRSFVTNTMNNYMHRSSLDDIEDTTRPTREFRRAVRQDASWRRYRHFDDDNI